MKGLPNPSAEVRRLADELNDRCLRANPFLAALFGLSGYNAMVPDVSDAAEERFRADLEIIADAAGRLDVSGDADDELIQAVVSNTVQAQLLDLDIAAVDNAVTAMPFVGPPMLLMVTAQTALNSAEAAADYLARLRLAGGFIDGVTERLHAGAARGRTPVVSLAAAAVDWVDTVLAQGVPDAVSGAKPPDGLIGASQWAEQVETIARESLCPALWRWRQAIHDELLPVARSDDHAGLRWIPGGDEDYLRAITRHTTLPLTAAELHRTGLDSIADLEEQARSLGATVGLHDLGAVRAACLSAQQQTPDAAMASARAAVRRAEHRALEVLSPPEAPPCAVEPMPATVAAAGMIPHYTLPKADGSRPGTYWFNTSTPTVGTGWDLEAVAFHEAVPGHHLQFARTQISPLPPLLTQSLVTVHAEGWGLYCERLAGEMGLYSTTQQQIGAIFMEIHRAARLVVDTGLHAFGWSRTRAFDFLRTHVPVNDSFLIAEVNRYIIWPGQALAYLTGQREILRLRAEARQMLGSRFDLPNFHSAVLGHGSLPLPVLRTVVARWTQSQRAIAGSNPGRR